MGDCHSWVAGSFDSFDDFLLTNPKGSTCCVREEQVKAPTPLLRKNKRKNLGAGSFRKLPIVAAGAPRNLGVRRLSECDMDEMDLCDDHKEMTECDKDEMDLCDDYKEPVMTECDMDDMDLCDDHKEKPSM